MVKCMRGMLKATAFLFAVAGGAILWGETTPASLEMTKRVIDVNGAQATIAIDIKATPEDAGRGSAGVVPNVLVLGTLCSSHGFTTTVLKQTLDTIAEDGNVDYYYYFGGATVNTTPGVTGSLAKGETYTIPSDLKLYGANHYSLNAFYTKLNELMTTSDGNGKTLFDKYDYVVFSFDRTRAVGNYTATMDCEAAVAAKLAPLYAKGHVIWLLDDLPPSYGTEGDPDYLSQSPWFVSGLFGPESGNSTVKGHWSTLKEYYGDSHVIRFKGLMGLFDPVKYTAGVDAMVTDYLTLWSTPEITSEKIAAMRNGTGCGATNPKQTVYDDVQGVAELLSTVIVGSSALHVTDEITAGQGLTLGTVTGYWTTDEAVATVATFDAAQWTELTAVQLVKSASGITVSLPGVQAVTWVRLRLNVADTGFFRTSVGATRNATTGKWEKDPNNGAAVATLTPDGSTQVLARTEAATSVAWGYSTYTISSTLAGSIPGKIYVDGKEMGEVGEPLSFAEGTSPELVFVADGGKMMSSLAVDGQTIADFDPSEHCWTFANLAADHAVTVAFDDCSYKLVRAKQRYPWNNLVDLDYYLVAGGVARSVAVCDRIAFFITYKDETGATVTKQLKSFVDDAGQPVNLRTRTDLRTAGAHRVTWDANADGIAVFRREGATFALRAFTGVAK